MIELGLFLKKRGVYVSWWATASDEEKVVLKKMLGDDVNLFKAKFPHSWYRSPQLRRELGEKIASVDLMHLHQVWDYPLFAAFRLATKYKLPYIISPRGIFTQKWRYNSFKKRVYLSLIAKPLLMHASAIHIVAKEELQGLRDIGIKRPYFLIPNGVNLKEFSTLPVKEEAYRYWPQLKGRRVAIYLGRLSPEKGLDILIRAWQTVVSEISNSVLLIAGPSFNGYRTHLERLVYTLKLDNHVIFSDFLDQNQKKIALNISDFYVQPSFSEGFSKSILEALACGKPCIITTGCNFSELKESGAGEIVPPRVDTLSAAILKFIECPLYRIQEMGEKGRQLIREKYDMEMIAQKFIMAYDSILAGETVTFCG